MVVPELDGSVAAVEEELPEELLEEQLELTQELGIELVLADDSA